MKNLIVIILGIIIQFFWGCGSATEVGNPTDLPVIISGVIDYQDIPNFSESKYVCCELEPTIDPTLLTVVADPIEGTSGTPVSAPVSADGSFSIEVISGITYSFNVDYSGLNIGDFSFEEDNQGNRGNSLVITDKTSSVNMGQVRYEEGVFVPEFEPRRQMENGND